MVNRYGGSQATILTPMMSMPRHVNDGPPDARVKPAEVNLVDDSIRISDGESHCRFTDAKAGLIVAPIIEINALGALLSCRTELEPNTYVDLTVALKGQAQRGFFANIRSSGDMGLRVQWMHIDPGEQKRLRELLDAYRAGSGGEGGGEGHSGTRRLVKPRSVTALTPFSNPVLPQGPASGASDRIGTRRVLRPVTKGKEEATGEVNPPPVVITSTEKFANLPAARTEIPTKSVPEEKEKETTSGQEGTPVRLDSLAAEEAKAPAQPTEASAPASAPVASAERSRPSGPDPLDLPADGGKSGLIKGQDGRLDIGASIRNKSKTVLASELAARHDKVRVLNMATIKALIQEAVEEAATHLTRALGEAERKRLLEEAEEGFQERLKSFQAEKLTAEVRAKQLAEQLAGAQRLLDEERKRTIQAEQFTVSEKGLEEIDVKLQKTIARALAGGGVSSEMEEQLRSLIGHVLDSEREKIRAKEMEAQNAKIELLEKKIRRLANSLEETEKQRDDSLDMMALMEKHGLSAAEVKNKYRTGLADDDARKAEKMAMIKEVVEQNRLLRQQLGIALNQYQEPTEKKVEAAKPPEPEAVSPGQETEAVPPSAGVALASEDSAEDPAGEADQAGEPEVNPDDLPWEPPAADSGTGASEAEERGVRVLRRYKVFEPPPLEKKA